MQPPIAPPLCSMSKENWTKSLSPHLYVHKSVQQKRLGDRVPCRSRTRHEVRTTHTQKRRGPIRLPPHQPPAIRINQSPRTNKQAKMTDCMETVCLCVCLCVWSKQRVTDGWMDRWMDGHIEWGAHSERGGERQISATSHHVQQTPIDAVIHSFIRERGKTDGQTNRHGRQPLINVCMCLSGRSTETDRSGNPHTVGHVCAILDIYIDSAQPQLSIARKGWLR